MKIAVITDDGEKISNHFGRAKFFKIFTVENDQVASVEQIDKPHHGDQAHHHDHHHDHEHGHEHGHHHEHGEGHSPGKFKVISDCQILVCGGMGTHAYNRALEKDYQVYLTGGDIQTAVEKIMRGELESDMSRVHQH